MSKKAIVFKPIGVIRFDRADGAKLRAQPFLQDIERGIFATRAPCRPNPIELSVVELLRREGHLLRFDSADILDGTPLFEIKPFTAKFDRAEPTCNGWQDEVDEVTARRRGQREFRNEIGS